MSDSPRKRRSVRQAISRTSSIYADPDTDDELYLVEGQDDDYHDRLTKRSRTSASTRSRPPKDDSEDRSNLADSPQPARPRKRPKRRSQRIAGDNVADRVLSGVGRKKQSRSKAAQHSVRTQAPGQPQFPSDHSIPQWQSLPYAILLQIFTFAFTEPDDAKWLLRSARVCRAFAEPALTAFYQRPHLPTARHLQELYLQVQPSTVRSFIDYRVKVKELALDINAFVSRKDEKENFDVGALVTALPRLESVMIKTAQDDPPYRRHAAPRWRYPNNLLDALDDTERQLKSWRWNWLLVKHAKKDGGEPVLYDYMCKYHSGPSFSTLRHVEISDHPEIVSEDPDVQHQEVNIAEAIALLPALTSLEMETCDIVTGHFLVKLPKSLTRLRLANCEALESQAMETFLTQDGGCQLKELILDHNVHLDISFLPLLKRCCSKLERLSMDLHYYSQHHTVNDAEAKYKSLLGSDDIPTWPTTLKSVELVHLQKWDADGARRLFGSLIDSSSELLDLRKIVLHAHISVAWRDRASFREQWIDRLRRVFLRRSKAPTPTLASLKAFRQSRLPKPSAPRPAEVTIPAISNDDKPDGGSPEHGASGRRSKRIAVAKYEELTKRAAERDTPESASSETSQEEPADFEIGFVQGMCDVMDVMIDNQRPREEQYNESHFLDSEESGDEDWNEGGEMRDDGDDGYAW